MLGFLTMLLLWDQGSPYWEVGLGYALMGIGVGFAGTPASHSLTSSVPVQRAGMASGTADLQRDLGGAIMQSIFGALLAAGYAASFAAAIAASPNAQKVSDSVEAQLTKSFERSSSVARPFVLLSFFAAFPMSAAYFGRLRHDIRELERKHHRIGHTKQKGRRCLRFGDAVRERRIRKAAVAVE